MVRDLIRPNLKPMFLYNTVADFQYAFPLSSFHEIPEDNDLNIFNNFEKLIVTILSRKPRKLKKAKAKNRPKERKNSSSLAQY